MSLCPADPRDPLLLRKLLKEPKFPQFFHAAGGAGYKVNSELYGLKWISQQKGSCSAARALLSHLALGSPSLPGALVLQLSAARAVLCVC